MERKIPTAIYNAFDTLSQRWYHAETQGARDEIGKLTNEIRDNNYIIKDCTEEANHQLYLNGIQFARHNIKIKNFSANDFMKVVTKINNGIALSTADYAISGIYWLFSVNNDGKWDYKRLNSDKEHREMAPDWWSEQGYFMYNGEIISDDDFGNINYGYLGTILGLSPETLYLIY